jgi:hypothetical protein
MVERIQRQFDKITGENVKLKMDMSEHAEIHNELLLVFIALMYQLGGEVIIKREHYPALAVFNYKLEWEDCPEEGGVKVKCYYREDEVDQQDK